MALEHRVKLGSNSNLAPLPSEVGQWGKKRSWTMSPWWLICNWCWCPQRNRSRSNLGCTSYSDVVIFSLEDWLGLGDYLLLGRTIPSSPSRQGNKRDHVTSMFINASTTLHVSVLRGTWLEVAAKKIGEISYWSVAKSGEFHGWNTHHIQYVHLLILPIAPPRNFKPGIVLACLWMTCRVSPCDEHPNSWVHTLDP